MLGQVYHPCCGSGGMFVQSEKFIEIHQGRIADTYLAWRRLGKGAEATCPTDGDVGHATLCPTYEDIKGFCKSAFLDEAPFEEKMAKLTKELAEHMQRGEALDAPIRKNLAKVGFALPEAAR